MSDITVDELTAIQAFVPRNAVDGKFFIIHAANDGKLTRINADLPLIVAGRGLPAIDIGKLRPKGLLEAYDEGTRSTSTVTSDITYIDGEKGELFYRGYRIQDLAEKCRYTEVSYLLLYGELPDAKQLEVFENKLKQYGDVSKELDALNYVPKGTHPMTFLQMAYSLLDGQRKLDPSVPEQAEEAALRAIAATPMINAMAYKVLLGNGDAKINFNPDLYFTENYMHMLHQASGNENFLLPEAVKAMDAALIVHGDHEQNCSTTTVRGTLSGGSGFLTAISSGMGALSGKEHGGANEAAYAQVQKIGSPDKVEAFVQNVQHEEALVFGFGHRVYRAPDPRAGIMAERTSAFISAMREKGVAIDPAIDNMIATTNKLEEVVAAHPKYGRLKPNVDFRSYLLYTALGLPIEMMTPQFAAGRISGMAAQELEQLHKHQVPILRPRQIYKGSQERVLPEPYGLRGKDHELFPIKARGAA